MSCPWAQIASTAAFKPFLVRGIANAPFGRDVIGLDDDNEVAGWYNAVRDTLSATCSDDCRHRPATCATYGLFATLVRLHDHRIEEPATVEHVCTDQTNKRPGR
jgi:hypothetical protein